MVDWTEFKQEFEKAGGDGLHLYDFEVEWSFNEFGSLQGKIEGSNQELTHDVEFTVDHNTFDDRFDGPRTFTLHWEAQDIASEEKFCGTAVVSSGFLAAAAIHYHDKGVNHGSC